MIFTKKIVAVLCTLVTLLSTSPEKLQAQCAELAVSCFVVGPYDSDILASDGITIFRDKDAFVSVPYMSSGRPGDATYTAPTMLARHRDIGTVFGVAQQAQSNDFVFTSAYTKRATGYGPLGAGGIYRVDPTAAAPGNITLWATIPNASNGTDPHNFDQFGDHLTTSYDNAVDKSVVGKTALGDLEMTLDGSTLYSVNLYNKHLYSMSATGVGPVTPIDEGLISSPAGCIDEDFQPFALGINPATGILHIGAVCTDESRTSTDGLHGYVLTFNGTYNHVFDFELENYTLLNTTTSWTGWWAGSGHQPLFVDIEFVLDDLIIGLRDRAYDWGYQPNASVHGRGDVLRACASGGTWVLENGGSCGGVAGSGQNWGPGGGEFFDDESRVVNGAILAENSAMGALVVAEPSAGLAERVIGTFNDTSWLVQGGLQYWSPADGSKEEDYEVFAGSPNGNGGENPVFGKTNGLGDIEIDCVPILLPIEIGELGAYISGSRLVVEWTTLSESNNSGFEVQYAGPNQDFNSLAWIVGAGTSSSIQSYSYSIDDVFPGLNRIRLKQIDFDGGVSYSDVVEIEVSLPDGFLLKDAYPNPFNPTSTIQFAVETTQAIDVKLYNANGMHVQTIFAGVAEEDQVISAKIDGRDLPSGVYMIRMSGSAISAMKTITLVK